PSLRRRKHLQWRRRRHQDQRGHGSRRATAQGLRGLGGPMTIKPRNHLEHGAMHGRGPSDHPEHTGHGGHGGHGDHAAMFRDRLWWTLALAVPVVVYSEMFQRLLGYAAPRFPGSGWVSPILGTAIFFYGGWPFLSGAVSELRRRQPGMMLLIGLAITVAFIASWATKLGTVDLDFWWELQP